MGAKSNGLGFLDTRRIGERYSPNLALARAEGRKLGLRPAKEQRDAGDSRLLILIDEELDFGDDGRLPVTGTYDDIRRLISRIVRGVESEVYTDFIVTFDVHPVFAIHNDGWWEDDHGMPPDVTFPVQMELVDPSAKYPFVGHFVDGTTKPYRPRVMRKWTIEKYAPHLKTTGQGNIWVFADHCREGTDGVLLIPALAEVIEWACAARNIQPTYMYKGMIPQVDWFGPFRPCMDVPGHPQGGLQTAVLDRIRAARRTEFAGEALDFCFKAGTSQAVEYYGKPEDKAVLESILFLTDCTSPIFPDDKDSGNTPNADFFAEMKSKGVQLIKHDADFE